MSAKYSNLSLKYCLSHTCLKVVTNAYVFPTLNFILTLCGRRRFVLLNLSSSLYACLSYSYISLLTLYPLANHFYHLARKLNGLLKDLFLSLSGHAIAFKKRFYLSGQVNRLRKLRGNRLKLQLGYSHKVRLRSLKFIRFRRWRRKKIWTFSKI